MKKIVTLLVAAVSTAVLSGCKSGINVPMTLGDVSGASQVREASLFLEITTCKDSKTGLDSKYLLEAKQQVAYVVQGAQFEKCVKDGFQDIALFKVPVTVGADAEDSKADLTIGVKEGRLQFGLADQARAKLAQVTENAYGFKPGDFEITLWIKNDSASDQKVFIPSAIVKAEGFRDTPMHNARVMLKKDAVLGFSLSNVAALQVLSGRGKADAVVFEEPSN